MLLRKEEWPLARAVARLAFCNPFLPERIACEREAMGADFVPGDPVWSAHGELDARSANVVELGRRADALASALRDRLLAGGRATDEELRVYEDVVTYVLYWRFEDDLYELATRGDGRATCWRAFARAAERFLALPGLRLPAASDLSHLFACFFQVRRAFHHTFRGIVGASMPAARLRAAVWQSIFTHDMRRYRRTLYRQMDDITTLVTGASGTGKELVARAIGLSRYVPFDATRGSFTADATESFHALNISALVPTLVESELFGHRRGAFTGALEDRAGWLEVCGPVGTVFLDEIGELDAAIQVKLLRVFQTRTFQRLGETKPRHFQGKLVAATNRDLEAAIAAGRFREDFYYRLCADTIVTPSLREQLADSPGELRTLIFFLAQRIAGAAEAEALADEVVAWIAAQLGAYAWPGNVRELEQCVRNVLVRREYRPRQPRAADGAAELANVLATGALTADELVCRYCRLVFERTGSYVETARRLGLDRRTVRAKVAAGRGAP